MMRYFSVTRNGVTGVAFREDLPPDWQLPEGWLETTQTEYDAKLVEVQTAREVKVEEFAVAAVAAVEARTDEALTDYNELIAAGISDRLARKLSGHAEEVVSG